MLGLVFLLFTFAIYPFCSSPDQIIVMASLFLGLFITALSFQEEREKARRHAQALENERARLEAECALAAKLALSFQAELMKSEESVKFLRKELNTFRVEHYQLSILAHLPPVPPAVEPPKPDLLYRQLRRQFEEKTEVLHHTRKDLFYTENALLALKRECAARDLEPNPTEVFLTEQLLSSFSACQAFELEIAELHQLITALLAPKKSAPKKTVKPKKRELLQASFI